MCWILLLLNLFFYSALFLFIFGVSHFPKQRDCQKISSGLFQLSCGYFFDAHTYLWY